MKNMLIKDWIDGLAGSPISSEMLLDAAKNFAGNRRNYTFEGKLGLSGASFNGQSLIEIDLSSFHFEKCTFVNCKVDRDVFLKLSTIARKKLIDLGGIIIDGLNLSDFDFFDLDLSQISFKNVILNKNSILSILLCNRSVISFAGVNLSKADLSGEVICDPITGVSGFNFFDLESLNFDGANFEEANLSGADLTSSSFANANFKNAKIIASIARNANFQNAKFLGASLIYSDFTGADFSYADLSNTTV